MATWIAHLRIVEKLLETVPGGDGPLRGRRGSETCPHSREGGLAKDLRKAPPQKR